MTTRPSEEKGFSALVDDLVAAVRGQHSTDHPIVLIDGGSGAGKSTLAPPLARALGAALVRLDDVYPGWDGLEAGSRAVYDEILPLGQWHRWDWSDERPSDLHRVDLSRGVVIEGCGALSRRARELADYAIWIELDVSERRRRAILRDGDTYAPHWERWAGQEREFFARERPDLLADIVIDGRVIPVS